MDKFVIEGGVALRGEVREQVRVRNDHLGEHTLGVGGDRIEVEGDEFVPGPHLITAAVTRDAGKPLGIVGGSGFHAVHLHLQARGSGAESHRAAIFEL